LLVPVLIPKIAKFIVPARTFAQIIIDIRGWIILVWGRRLKNGRITSLFFVTAGLIAGLTEFGAGGKSLAVVNAYHSGHTGATRKTPSSLTILTLQAITFGYTDPT
jgi:hypothetical protein